MSLKPEKSTVSASEREPKRALGRGLSALIPSSARSVSPATAGRVPAEPAESDTTGLRYIPLLKIALNPYQPREEFPAEQLQELSESIRQHGVLQPIVVRPTLNGTYELVAGERRFRAATNAGLTEIPAVIRDINDKSSLAIALIENIQRQELNPVESARAYQRLLTEFRLTQLELALEVGKSQPSIANSLRLLALPDQILDSLSSGEITEGHAKAILSLEPDTDKITLWQAVLKNSLNVRETERRASAMKSSIPRGIPAKSIAKHTVDDYETERLEEDLSLALGTRVRIKFSSRDKGQIEIQFYALDQLDGILQKIGGSKLGQ